MAYLALYRKYRPKTFEEVVGQELIVRILKNQITNERIGHAYLFTGIRGTGKTTLAKIFAKAINCEDKSEASPCLKCKTCLHIEEESVMDIIEIDGASNRGVDEIRDIREKVMLSPSLGKYTVYIIDEVHMLTKEAFNALLKTLEEPPSHIVFIFATTEPAKLPITILSRCQRFDIKPINTEDIYIQLQNILKQISVKMEDKAVSLIAKRGDHSLRDALSLLDQLIDIGDKNATITLAEVLGFLGLAEEQCIENLVEAILDGDKRGCLLEVKALIKTGKYSKGVFAQTIEKLRDVLIVKVTADAAEEILEIDADTCKRLSSLAEKISQRRLEKIINLLIEEQVKLKHSGLAQFILELALLKATDIADPKNKIAEGTLRSNPDGEIEEKKHAQTISDETPAVKDYGTLPPPKLAKMPVPEIDFPKKAVAAKGTVGELSENKSQKVSHPTEAEMVNKKSPELIEAAKLETTKDIKNRDEQPLVEKDPAVGVVEGEIIHETENIDYPLKKLKKELIACTLKERGMLATHVKRAVIEKTDTGYCLMYYKDAEGVSSESMIKRAECIKYLSGSIENIVGKKVTLKTRLAEKTFDEMTAEEKTRAILDDETIPLIVR